MAKNKYDFIQDLLKDKRIKQNQRERVLLLAKEEIKKDGEFENELANRIKRLEEVVLNPNEEITPEEITPEEIGEGENGEGEKSEKDDYKDLPNYFHPSSLYNFLLKYNTNSVLKSTCHEIDSNELSTINEYCGTDQYDFEKHLTKIISEASKLLVKEFAPWQIKKTIRGYLIGKDYKGNTNSKWSSDDIPINWQNKELKQWCEENPGIPPNIDEGLMEELERTGYELNQPILLQNNAISTFSDLVLHFKHLFHIRSDNSLKSIIKTNNKVKYENKIDFQIDDDFPNNIEFFTDVDTLVQAYNKIIALIIEQDKYSKPKVRLSLVEKEKTIELSILHCDSKYGKTINNTKDRLGNIYRNLIKYQINGLCNFYVQADFESGESYKIGIWDKPDLWKKNKPIPKKLSEPVGGVKHIFEIVKP